MTDKNDIKEDASGQCASTVGLGAAINDVIAERKRQIEIEGWDSKHDDEHDAGELASAGVSYALNAACIVHPLNGTPIEGIPLTWPWAGEWWKPTSPRRDLVKAAALIIAEIDRMDRAASVAPNV